MTVFDEAFREVCHRESGRHEVVLVRSVQSLDRKRILVPGVDYLPACVVGWLRCDLAIIEFRGERWLAPEGSWEIDLMM